MENPGLGRESLESVFTDIFLRNGWSGTWSVSGKGSELKQTKRVATWLPQAFQRYGVRTVLDIPCGDFYWMQSVNLEGIEYLGADVVRELVAQNEKHARPKVRFRALDLVHDPLPRVDWVLVRDGLVHLSTADVLHAIQNLVRSGSRYLCTTTFPRHPINYDITCGEWRTLNFLRAPFFFPPPVEILEEGCTEQNGRYTDKSLGVWCLAELRERFG